MIFRGAFIYPTFEEHVATVTTLLLVRPVSLKIFGTTCPLDRLSEAGSCGLAQMWHALYERALLTAIGSSIVYFVHIDRRRAWLLANSRKIRRGGSGRDSFKRREVSGALDGATAATAEADGDFAPPRHHTVAAASAAPAGYQNKNRTGEATAAEQARPRGPTKEAAAAAAAEWGLRLRLALQHPNLAQYFPMAAEAGEEAGAAWELTDFCDGGSAAGLLGLYGAFPPAVVRRWGARVSGLGGWEREET